jgi:pimeloyl-ACP methyl ester carboxylesterase
VHAVIEALGAGPVEMFASSGGAVTALALVAAYPDDVMTLVAHEPPLIPVLPDAAAAERARAAFATRTRPRDRAPAWRPSSR